MNELIKITETEGKQTVSARELHQKLGIEHRFNDWFKRMLKYGFVENKDFTSVQVCTEVQNNGGIQKRELVEYYLSLDMAKEICMIQRSEIGRTFRQYFIECEKELKNIVTKVEYITKRSKEEIDLERARFIYEVGQESPIETYKEICSAISVNMVAGQNLLPMPKLKTQIFTASQIAEELHISKNRVGAIANKNNLKQEEYGEWIWDRAANGKQVKNFVYNSKGFEKIKEFANA